MKNVVNVRKPFWRKNWQAVFLFSRIRRAVFQVGGRAAIKCVGGGGGLGWWSEGISPLVQMDPL